MTSRNLLLVFIALIVAALVSMLLRTCSRPVQVSKPPGVSERLSQPSGKSELERESGLKTVRLKNAGEVSVEVTVKKWCGPGDLDAIKLDLEHSDDKTILLTLEPVNLSEGGFSPLVKKVEPGELFSGFNHKFSLPRLDSGVLLGIFLCKDSAHKNRCADKPGADFNEIFSRYMAKGHPRANAKADDKSYFYQFLALQKGSVTIFEKTDISRLAYRKAGRYLSDRVSVPPEAIQKALDTTEARNKVVRSLALDTEGGRSDVSLVLPIYDQGACQRKEYPLDVPAEIPKTR